MKKRILLLFLATSFVFALAVPIQLPLNTRVFTTFTQHGG